jgi:glycerol-3-phosphate dehydrogenase (NAD(P)+)
MSSPANIGIVGAGAWGTALAQSLAASDRRVTLWARNRDLVDALNATHRNQAYLPDVTLDPRIEATHDLAAVAGCHIILLVAPAQQTRAMAALLRPHLTGSVPVVICAKGLEQSTGSMLSDVLAEALPVAQPAVLSGPSFAHDVVRGLPTAVTLATTDEALGSELANTLGSRTFRVYWTSDMIGAQLGGALKNVLAIAAGIVDGKMLGASAHAALVTRGFAELRRFASAYGARPETLMGLSGLGDLVLTCGSGQSRNMSLGRALGQGQTLDQILAGRRSVSEGVYTATAVNAAADSKALDMPICRAVAEIITGAASVDEAIGGLLARPFKAED